MRPLSHSSITPEAVKLLQRIIHLRSHFKVVPPENFATLRKKIHEFEPFWHGCGI